MKTACRACGSVREHRLNFAKDKIVCESCNAEIVSTAPLRSVLAKKGLVRAENEPLAAVPKVQTKPVGVLSLTDEEAEEARLAAGGRPRINAKYASKVQRGDDDRSGNYGGYRGGIAREEARPVDVYDQKGPNVTAVRYDPTAPPLVKRPETPSARAARKYAESREPSVRKRYVNSTEGVKRTRKLQAREQTIHNGLAEKGLDLESAQIIIDSVFED